MNQKQPHFGEVSPERIMFLNLLPLQQETGREKEAHVKQWIKCQKYSQSVHALLLLATLTWRIRWTSLLNMDLSSSLASIPILLKIFVPIQICRHISINHAPKHQICKVN